MNYVLTQKNLFDCIQRRVEWEKTVDPQYGRIIEYSEFARALMSLLKLEVATNVR